MGIPVPDNFTSYPVDGLFKVRLFQLTLPDNDYAPAFRLQLSPHLLVPLLVPGDFSYPELCVGFGDRIILAVFVAMPKASVYEDNRPMFG